MIHSTILIMALAGMASAQYADWRHSGSFYVLTTRDGADLPATASEVNFPLLLRLDKGNFDFSQAGRGGEDVRFSAAGKPLAYQIEEWNAAKGMAAVWVRVPEIKGNTQQEIRLHWGKPGAISESSGKAVFNEGNGFLSVWHMTEPLKDEVETLESKDVGTTATAGMIGPARHFAGEQGIYGGDKIIGYPVGSAPQSTEAWFRPEQVNGRVLGWGNDHGQGKTVMNFNSPPHVRMEGWFSGLDVRGTASVPLGEWVHVVHTYVKGDARVYVNGVLAGVNQSGPAHALKSPAKLWIGGWSNDFNFVGDIDEVRISKKVRSADWVKLQYENQKPLQSLVGHITVAGGAHGPSLPPVGDAL